MNVLKNLLVVDVVLSYIDNPMIEDLIFHEVSRLIIGLVKVTFYPQRISEDKVKLVQLQETMFTRKLILGIVKVCVVSEPDL